MEIIIAISTSVLSAMLIFILQSYIKENRRLREKQENERTAKDAAIENGVRQLLSVRLEEMYDRYADSETIPKRAHVRWQKLHAAYKGLHGNGTFDRMDEEMNDKHIVND